MKKDIVLYFAVLWILAPAASQASYHFADFKGHPPLHIYSANKKTPTGLSPDKIKSAYNLPATGGKGVIAIIDAYASPTLEKDLAVFNSAFGLASCTVANGCLELHPMAAKMTANSGWALETALDVEWAHAIAPQAKILLVEAVTPSGANLINAVDYTRGRSDVAAISMSWGGAEFSDETTLDTHFVSSYGAIFFASSGDNGAGVSWPASSPHVVGVGGTTLTFSKTGAFQKELAWPGSGGGVSAYESQPSFQAGYNISKANKHRAVPDVSYNADPKSGYSVYEKGAWYVLGGTSAGAPQWAAIQALGGTASNDKFYTDKAGDNNKNYFRDIISGSNGDCTYYCDAHKHYDYITGLGSPLTATF